MTAWLARSLAEQGQYAAAERHVADVMRQPHVSPITQVSVLPVAGVLAARRGDDGTGALDEALTIAVRTGEALRLVPVAAACAEAAWIAGRTPDLVAAIDRAWPAAVAHPHPWGLGELSWWLHLGGDDRPAGAPLARPFALMLAGEHRAAASRVGGPGLPAVVGLRAGLLARDQGRAAVPGRPGQAGCPGRAPRRAARPARPRAGRAARPPAGQPRQPGRAHRPGGRGAPAARATGCPTPRSPSGSSCPRRPWVTTSRRCCASSGSRPGPGRSPPRCGSGSSRQDREHARCAARVRPGFPGAGRQRACSATRERKQPWRCSWTRTRWVARSPWTTWRRHTPPTCRPRTLTGSTTFATGSTRSTARSSAWWTPRTPTRRPGAPRGARARRRRDLPGRRGGLTTGRNLHGISMRLPPVLHRRDRSWSRRRRTPDGTRRKDVAMMYGRLTVNPVHAAWNTVARFDDYGSAQRAVDRLSDDGFPVEQLEHRRV